MSHNSQVLRRAKELRRNMTGTEKILWEELRNRKLKGLKFRRQMPLCVAGYNFIADFYCPQHKLIIETDGGVHDSTDAQEYDKFREDILITNNFKVIRFRNEEVENNPQQTLKDLANFIKDEQVA